MFKLKTIKYGTFFVTYISSDKRILNYMAIRTRAFYIRET